MADSLSAAQARRVLLAAQGLARSRTGRKVGEAQFGEYLARQGVLQLDTVNVFARAHYMPMFSRYGPYAPDALDTYVWGAPDGHSPHTFEHWGHEASVMPRELLPALHHRMVSNSSWKTNVRARLEAERPGLIAAVLEAVGREGPATAGSLEHMAPRETPRGTWWDSGHVKDALEYLFITGQVVASRARQFQRTYDDTLRVWGVPPAPEGDWGLPADAAHQELFDRGLAATGVGTPRDIADHFRLLAPTGTTIAHAQAWASSAVERGLARWVTVEGWDAPALLAASAVDPGRATGAALLSPFDPVCWYRPRLERMFAVDYRIEIYTPEPKRIYGYYCLPFLLGDQIVARVDLKADRKAKTLLVQAAWREPRVATGARRRSDAEVADALAAELRLACVWMGLEGIGVAERGDLAAALRVSVEK
jgi:uncharacterized protein YcaQ